MAVKLVLICAQESDMNRFPSQDHLKVLALHDISDIHNPCKPKVHNRMDEASSRLHLASLARSGSHFQYKFLPDRDTEQI